MNKGPKRSARWRSISLLVLALLLGGVGAGVGNTALKPVTKKKADKKFLQNTTIVQQAFPVQSSVATPLQVMCPPGQQAVGGGVDSPSTYSSTSGSDTMIAPEQRPIISGARSIGWYVEAAGQGTGAIVTVYAVCSK